MDAAVEGLFLNLAKAEDTVSRLDARAQTCAFAEGWAARVDFIEANGWGWVSGEIVDMEDLVLHDAQMDARLPDQALRATYGLVRARRRARGAGAELQTAHGAAWLAGYRGEPPLLAPSSIEPDEVQLDTGPETRDLVGELTHLVRSLSRGETADPLEAIEEWVQWTRRLPGRAPALLRAAAALEGWRLVNPLPRQTFVGGVMVAQALRLSGRTRSCLLAFEAPRRTHLQPPRGFMAASTAARLAYWLKVVAVGAEAGLGEMKRLELARQVVLKRVGGRRSNDRSADLVDLLLARPLVSAAMAAEHLGVAGHTARRLLTSLGASVMEVSGRSRYRAWRL
ncbi:DUF1612 domain-containing protein [Caulobacter sp. CCH5-E12]|uniref:DUF1612 domain-containing protein n=1 Tax=Caulobacter sp. CCH5-E12 TaxID=1768770 RepID=UPI0007816339|nr:DUF1612 domain-containing protein [Caulobacter sp. CCH5-E12]